MSKKQLMADLEAAVQWKSISPSDLLDLIEKAEKCKEALAVARAALEYIDALPGDIKLDKSMPGFDRDWADSVVT